jgi:hypothetical protein
MNSGKSWFVGVTRGWLMSLAVVLGLFLFMSVPRIQAESVERCQRRIAHAEHELHEAIEHHGRRSRQADHERRELHEARERCWREHHRWWDEHEHRWREQRDWDEHDHDRD